MLIEVANGELVDKVTILSIKLEKMTDKDKLQNVQKEYDLLIQKMGSIQLTEKSEEYQELLKTNLKLWEVEDQIRVKELNQEFDDEFIRLARSVYFLNDKRSEVKKAINIMTGSDLIEEKAYVKYQ